MRFVKKFSTHLSYERNLAGLLYIMDFSATQIFCKRILLDTARLLLDYGLTPKLRWI